jgi:serine/threonine protein kinase
MTHIKGVTLKEYVNQRHSSRHNRFDFLDALTLTEKLLQIVKNIHARGIVHRDLKPDNIMISFERYDDPTEQTELFVIDFGLAYIETQKNIDVDWSEYDQNDDTTELGDSIGNRWYRVPQLYQQDVSEMTAKEKNDLSYIIRRSPTIDASSICAIFFWMLTQKCPKKNRDEKTNLAPHQEESKTIKTKIDDVVSEMSGKCHKNLAEFVVCSFDITYCESSCLFLLS